MIIEPNIQHPDEFYAALVALHEGLSVEESLKLNAKLILLLANQINDAAVLSAILAAGRAVRPRR